jgi:2-polyprenyl-3-methyl-5-hydroxy-6-metoxy-1,4-benzoquinol methylase
MFETVVGLDISVPRLIVAKKQLEETGRQAVLIAANAEFLRFPDGSFHLIVGSDVIEHLENPPANAASSVPNHPSSLFFRTDGPIASLGPYGRAALSCD